MMTSQGTAHGRFQRAIHSRNVQNAEVAAREMGGLSLTDALLLCELLANVDPSRYERAALRWLARFIDERLPRLAEVALAASALAELRHGQRDVGGGNTETVAEPELAASRSVGGSLELPATTLARLTGHADAGFTLKVYARDGRDEAATFVDDVLARTAGAKIGG
jgi:hypothetical protein